MNKPPIQRLSPPFSFNGVPDPTGRSRPCLLFQKDDQPCPPINPTQLDSFWLMRNGGIPPLLFPLVLRRFFDHEPLNVPELLTRLGSTAERKRLATNI